MNLHDDVNRRKFMSAVTKAVGSAMLLSTPIISEAGQSLQGTQSWTVGQIIDLFIKQVPGAPFNDTVDTLKAGNRDIKVMGIVTSMFATLEVIQKAIELKANFIIAHEPTYYSHMDDISWLKNDEVYRYKVNLLSKNSIAVWRNHDYIHKLALDGVRAGVIAQLKWGKYFDRNNPNIFEMPGQNLGALIAQVKEKLGITTLRYMGDLSQPCTRVLLMPGAAGGRNQITTIGRKKPDVVICGEIVEWETPEYIRDARTKGDRLALIVLGHIAGEEPGSEFMASWLKEKVKGVTTTHVPTGDSLKFV